VKGRWCDVEIEMRKSENRTRRWRERVKWRERDAVKR
jgi:hypothetical protein